MTSPVIPVLSKIDPNKWEGTTRGVQLEEDLTRMGCMGLYEKPWIFQKGRAAVELIPPGTPRGVYRANPLAWTREVWCNVYSFAEEKGWRPEVNRELLEKHIASSYDVSECYRSDQFKNSRLRRVVEFLNPIFHPNRRERITARLATTYIQAFFEISFPDWGMLLEEAFLPQLRAVQQGGCSKTFITPYLMHLYENYGCLEPGEARLWKLGMVSQDHSPRTLPRLTNGILMPPVSHPEASSPQSLWDKGRSSRSPRENPPPPRAPKNLTLVERVAKFSRDVTRDVQQMEMELLEARSLQRALRELFGVEDTRDILAAARETREQLARVKKDLRTSQKEHLDMKAKAQETMMTLTKLLAEQTNALTVPQDRSPTRKKRRFIPTQSLSSDDDTPPTCLTSGAGSPSSKDWGVKVYMRHRDRPVNLPGSGSIDPSSSRMDSPSEAPIYMLEDPVDSLSNIPVDTPNIPVDTPMLPVEFPVETSNLPVDSHDHIPVDTPDLPVNPSMDLPEDTSTSPEEPSG